MTKVIIYEDNAYDLVGKYFGLSKEKYDIHVRFGFMNHPGNVGVLELLASKGFNNVKDLDFDSAFEEADVYFVDGLKGYCFEVLRQLPRERSFLFSGDSDLVNEAKKQGYQTIEHTLERTLDKLLKQGEEIKWKHQHAHFAIMNGNLELKNPKHALDAREDWILER